jgi:membrane associated rhomboid family serine protease
MRGPTSGVPAGFGIEFTELTKRALIVLVSAYIVQLVLMYWFQVDLGAWVFLNRIGGGHWWPWQPATSLLFNSPSVISAAISWLFLLFFLGPVERLMGRRRMLTGLAFSAALGALFTSLVDVAGGLASPVPFTGLEPVLTALVVFFGLTMPNATIRLMFIIPIKAGWVAWGSGVIALLYFLASRDLGSAMALGGWAGAVAFMRVGPDQWKKIVLRWRARNVEKELEKFTVIDGGRGDDDEYIH